MSNEQKNRRIYLDILRIIASLLVIFNHTGYKGYLLFLGYEIDSLPGWLLLFISILTKINVPLFYMISGAVLLGKDETLKKVLCRVLKYVLIIVVFSSMLYMKNVIMDGEKFTPIEFLLSLLSSHYNYTYYFLYSYVAYLLILPVLRAIAKNVDKKVFPFLFVLCLIAALNKFTAVTYQWPWFQSRLVPVIIDTNYFMYPLFGYYIHNLLDRDELKKKLYILVPLSLVLLIVSSYYTFKYPDTVNIDTQQYHTIFTFCFAVTFFAIFKYVIDDKQHSNKSIKIITFVSSLTLGIYLLHEPILHMEKIYGLINVLRDYIGKLPAVSLVCLLVFIIAGTITYVLKKLPIFRKLI